MAKPSHRRSTTFVTAPIGRDQIWIRAFYGEYLGDLLGYDGIYVRSSDDKIVFGFADGRDETRTSFEQLAPEFEDLVAAIRKPGSASANYDIIATPIAFADGPFAEHRAVADALGHVGTHSTIAAECRRLCALSDLAGYRFPAG